MAVVVSPSTPPPKSPYVTLTPPLIQGAGPDTTVGAIVLATSDGSSGPDRMSLAHPHRILCRVADLLDSGYTLVWLPDRCYLKQAMGSGLTEFEWELVRVVHSADASLVVRGDLSPNEWRRSPYEAARNGDRSLPGPVTDRSAE